MTKNKIVLRKLAISFLFGQFIAITLFLVTPPDLSSPIAFISYHALLSFLAVTTAALAFLANYHSPSPAKFILYVALLFRCVIHFGIAAAYSFVQLDISLENAPLRAIIDMLSLFIFCFLFLVSVILDYRRTSTKVSLQLWTTILLMALGIYGVFFFVIIPSLLPAILLTISFILLFLSIIVVLLSISIIYLNQKQYLNFEIHYIIAALITFLIAPLALYGYSIGIFTFWIMAIIQQSLGFCFLYLGIGESVYTGARIGRNATNAILSFLLALCIAPFALGILSHAYAPVVLLYGLGAYLISHGAAAFLSAMTAILLFLYFKRKPAWNLLPLMTMYISWTFIEISILFYNPLLYSIGWGESLVPYILGGIVSLLVVYRTITFTTLPPKEDPTEFHSQWISGRVIVVAIGTILSILIENALLENAPVLQGFPLGRIFLMFINLLALFGFSLLLFITTRKFSDWKSIEGVAIISLAFFIIPGILKGVFLDWTIGWWVGDLLLLMGLGLGPPLLGMLYLDSMENAQHAERRATLYSDLLVHDITNMHQAILVALSIMEHDLGEKHKHFSTIKDAKSSLDRAAEIVSSVRQISLAAQTDDENLHPIDIVAVLFNAYHQIKAEYPNENIDFSVNKLPEQCFTKANYLLLDLFYNLFRNAISYSGSDKRIDVFITRKYANGNQYWNIQVEDYGKGIEESRKKHLFKRFMKGAEGLGLGLSVVMALTKSFDGFVEVIDRVPGDHSKGTVFIISLPMERPEISDLT